MKKKIAVLLAVIMLISVCTACGSSDSGEEVMVESVADICGLGSVGLADRFAGIVSPQGETKIKRSTDGSSIAEMLVKVGDSVTTGQVLFKYDTEQTSLNIERAQLELEQLNASVSSMRDEKAALEAEKATVSEELQLSYSIEIRDLEANIQQAGYSITAKSKEIARMQESLKSSEVKSPTDGKIQSINENGGYDDMGNELPLMTIVQTDGFRVKGYVNETNAYALGEGTSVIIRSRVSEELWYGSVSMIDWDNPVQNTNYYYGDTDTANSSRYPFYVELESSDGLMLGQHVYIEPDYGQAAESESNALMLPSYYIADPDGNPFVWAQNGKGKLEKRSLSLGEYNAEMDTYEVLDGLTAEDCIAFPDENLKEGMICVDYASYVPEESVTEAGGADFGGEVYYENAVDDGVVLYGDAAEMPADAPEVDYAS